MDTRAFFVPAALSLPLAVLLAAAAAGGIVLPAAYARESASWTAQGIGQDWVDLVLVAPALFASALYAMRGARLAALVLGGLLVYAAYSLVLYAFAVHFNPLFLVYSIALGFSFYALVSLVLAFQRSDVPAWFSPRAPVRLAGVFAVLLGLAFYALWLSEVIPALVAGTVPKSITDSGLITNPVQVLDLGIVLPAFIVGGLALVRRRPIGFWLVPVTLTFGVIMDVALIAMVVSMSAHGLPDAGPPLPMLIVMTVATLLVLWAFVRRIYSVSNVVPAS